MPSRSITLRRWVDLVAIGLVLLLCQLPASASEPSSALPLALPLALPWQVLDDPRHLPRPRLAERAYLRSSTCPRGDGCASDSHDWRQPRWLSRTAGDGGSVGEGTEEAAEEAVIFDHVGSGVISRLWMTGGDVRSRPLGSDRRLRIYFDDQSQPAIDLPLGALFDGSTPPFIAPWTLDRASSGGGNVLYLPIAYRQRCRLTLVGEIGLDLAFQVHYRELDPATLPADLVSGPVTQGLDAWHRLLEQPGSDPWPQRPADDETRTLRLVAGQQTEWYADSGPGLLTGLRLQVEDAWWPFIDLVIELDGHETVRAALEDVFAAGRASASAPPTRGLLVGYSATAGLYSYLPIAYQRSARLALEVRAPAGANVAIETWLRRDAEVPAADSGLLSIIVEDVRRSRPHQPMTLVDVDGAGHWVGLFAEVGSLVGDRRRWYLDSDESVWVDGLPWPAQRGTGLDDFFAAGFYVDSGPFASGMHGISYQLPAADGDVTAGWRQLLIDAVPFRRGLRVEIETGPHGDTPMQAHSVAYLYLLPARQDPARLDAAQQAAEHQQKPATGD